VLVADDLADWEVDGGKLELSGRDPLPAGVTKTLTPEAAEALLSLVAMVVEIGLVDAYGADTTEPLRFTNLSVEFLESEGISAPSVATVMPWAVRETVGGWGSAVGAADYATTREWCMTTLGS